MKRKNAKPVDEKYVLFDQSTTCAVAAAQVFQQKRWRWKDQGIPSTEMILKTLTRLHSNVGDGAV
jgi:hypothetical protein